MLRKWRSLNLHLASACGNGAIDLLCAVIRQKCSAVRGADSWPSTLNGLKDFSGPGGKQIEGTAEQIAVEPSIGSRVRPIACGRSSSLKLSCRRLPRLIQTNHLKKSARVIQIAQKSTRSENLLANDQAVVRIGLSIREHRTKNSVAQCATTLYAQQ
jgi:hypothetical protein